VLSDQGIELDKVFEILNSGREYAMIRPYKGGHSLAIDSAHLELLEPKTSFRDPVIQILDYQAQLRNGNSILWYTGVNQEDNLSFGTSSSEELALDLELFLKINHFPVPEENSFVEALIKRFYSGEKKIMIITERIPSSLSLLDNEGISLYVQCQEKVSSIAVQALYGGKSLTGEKEAINELSSQKWDVIFFLHEPETLLSRKELTEKIARALVPGGKLLFSLKNPRAINSLDSYLSDYSPKPILFYTSDWKGLLEPLDLEVIYEPVMFGYNENEIVYNELKDALEKAFPHAGAKISGTIRETARLMCAVKKGGDRK
jgi:hypothetical protein